jgi:ferredoxin--NADP+ reductase
MYEIIKKEKLSENIYRMVVNAPWVAKNALPGQFLIVRVDEEGERIALTICDYDPEKGTVDIVFQPAGAETYRMSLLEEGQCFHDVVGPLGKPSDLTRTDPKNSKT